MYSVFERDFDQELVNEEIQAAAGRDQVFTQSDLDLAVQTAKSTAYAEGYAIGQRDGLEESNSSLQRKYVDAIEATAPGLDQLLAQISEHQTTLETQLVRFTHAVCEKLFPEFLAQRSMARATEQIRDVMALTLGCATVRIFLSQATTEKMTADLQSTLIEKTGHRSQHMEIQADPTMADGDARVEWDDGFMDYSFDRVCSQIMSALKHAAAPNPDHENKEAE